MSSITKIAMDSCTLLYYIDDKSGYVQEYEGQLVDYRDRMTAYLSEVESYRIVIPSPAAAEAAYAYSGGQTEFWRIMGASGRIVVVPFCADTARDSAREFARFRGHCPDITLDGEAGPKHWADGRAWQVVKVDRQIAATSKKCLADVFISTDLKAKKDFEWFGIQTFHPAELPIDDDLFRPVVKRA